VEILLKYKHYGFFHLRTPALPASWVEAAFAAEDPGRLIDSALNDDLIRAILWATAPKLMELRTKPGARRPEVDLALTRYLIRAASRCTPTGLLSGGSIGKIADKANLSVAASRTMAADLDGVAQDEILSKRPELTEPKRVGLNPGLQFVGDIASFPRPQGGWGGVTLSGRVARFLRPLAGDIFSARALGRDAARRFGGTPAQGRRFVASMLQAGILVSADEPPTVTPKTGVLARRIPERGREPYVSRLKSIHLKEPARAADEVESVMRWFSEELPSIRRPVHFELMKKTDSFALSEKQLEELAGGAAALDLLFLDHFRQVDDHGAFVRRTLEMNQALGQTYVPLKDAIGPLTGLDTLSLKTERRRDAALIDFLHKIRGSFSGSEGRWLYRISRHETQELLDKRAGAAKRTGSGARTMAALVQLVRCDGQDLLWLKGTVGGTALSWISRFSYFDPALKPLLEKIAANEQRLLGDCADIAVAFPGPMQNVMRRPPFFSRRIFCNEPVSGGGRDSTRLALDDLLLCAHIDRLVVYSRSLGKPIRPVLASALDAERTDSAALKLLLQAGMQDYVPRLNWSWSEVRSHHYPRVQYGNVILVPEQWRIPAAQLRKELGAADSDHPRVYARLRERWQLPGDVCIFEGDRHLPLRLDSAMGLRLLRDRLGAGDEVCFIERFAESAVRLNGAEHAAEALIPLYAEGPRAPAEKLPARPVPFEDAARSFPPGSECAYFTLYSNLAAQDEILLMLAARLPALKRRLGLRRWFYVRYDFPRNHLRLRFFLSGPASRRFRSVATLATLFESWRRLKLVTTVSVETYNREIEVYGGVRGVELFEAVSEIDSDWTTEFLRTFDERRGKEPPSLRDWGSIAQMEFAFIKTWTWLRVLGLDPAETREFLAGQGPSRGLASDDSADTRAVSEAYRATLPDWISLLTGRPEDLKSPRWAWHLERAKVHQPRLSAVYARWRDSSARGEIAVDRFQLLRRAVHMGFNRLSLRLNAPREREFYGWLLKASLSAQKRRELGSAGRR